MIARAKAWWIRNFYAAFAVLLLLKLALVANNILGTEGYAPWYNVVSKLPLLLGNDILGAGLLATAITVLCIPWLRLRTSTGKGAFIFAGILQAAHAVMASISFFATLYVGGPLNKEVIELAFQGSDEGGGAMWSSISTYLGPLQIGTMIISVIIAVNVFQMYPHMVESLRRRWAVVWTVALSVLFALGVLLLPWLINGHLLGIRIHTYGLERSAGVEMTWSYVKPVFRAIARPDVEIEDEFFLDMSSMVDDDPGSIENPLRDAKPRKTNVIYISLESVGAPYADEDPSRMPFLRGIGKRDGGVYFSDHYGVWPQTMKAFFSLFCSELPYPDYRPITVVNPSIPCISLSEVLHDHGYHTALVTSADLAYDRKRRFFKHREFDTFTDMRDMPGRETAWGDSWGLDERLAVKNILELADRKRDDRFFVFYEMFTAHHPYNACKEHEDNPLDEFPAYLRALRYIDDRIRDISEGLRALGLEDETLIAIASDHGEGFGQHPGSRGHGAKVYQENIQVPFALIGPQLEGISGEVAFPTSHIDVAPTILGLLGIDSPCTMKGRDLTTTSEPRTVLFGGRSPGAQAGIADGRWKYIREENGMELLFDLRQDAGETTNLVSKKKDLAGRFSTRLDEWEVFSENLIENYSEVRGRSSCQP